MSFSPCLEKSPGLNTALGSPGNITFIDRVWLLEKYARSENNSWFQIQSNGNELLLRIEGSQLLILQHGTAVDSLSLISGSSQLRGVWKCSTIVIAVKYKSMTRRIRVKFAASKDLSDVLNCQMCVQLLQLYMPISEHSETNYREEASLTELHKFVMGNRSGGAIPAPPVLMPDFPLQTAIRSCLLDPAFPQLVSEVEACLNQFP